MMSCEYPFQHLFQSGHDRVLPRSEFPLAEIFNPNLPQYVNLVCPRKQQR